MRYKAINLIFSHFIIISSLIFFGHPANGQTREAPLEKSLLDNSLNDIYVVMGIGLGGAVLGLSTLSFVDKPSENLKNIAIGGALGIIVGVGVVVWRQMNQSKSFYYENASSYYWPSKKFSTAERISWHRSFYPSSPLPFPSSRGNLAPATLLFHFSF